MKITELLSMCKLNDSKLSEVLSCHPKKIISDGVDIPVWKVYYAYDTLRNTWCTATKYLFLNEAAWDSVENEFNSYIVRFNENNPDGKLSNVKILDMEYLGEIYLPIE